MRTKSIALAIAAVLVGAIGGSMLSPGPRAPFPRKLSSYRNRCRSCCRGSRPCAARLTANNASMRTLVQQSLDSVNALNAQMGTLQKNVQEATANSGSKIDTMSSQTQGLSDNLSDVQARVGKLATQMNDMQSTLQSIDGRLAGGAHLAAPLRREPALGPGLARRVRLLRVARLAAGAMDFLRCRGFRRTPCTRMHCGISLPGNMTSRGRNSATT